MTGTRTTRWLATIVATTAILLTGASAATADARTVTATRTSGQVTLAGQSVRYTELKANLTPAQLMRLHDGLTIQAHDSATPGRNSATGSDVSASWQSGFDRDHWWFKISRTEVITIGAGAACRAAFGGASWFVCPPLVAAINGALSVWPVAGGFWAELYTDGRVRVGTW